MILISHRGNLNGPNQYNENKPSYIVAALDKGYHVEVDVWRGDRYWTGHDEPKYETTLEFLSHPNLWLHAKNVKAFHYLLSEGLNVFWHQEDYYALTSKGYIWAYPNYDVPAGSKSIAVLPEWHNTNVENFAGVCSDYITNYDKISTV